MNYFGTYQTPYQVPQVPQQTPQNFQQPIQQVQQTPQTFSNGGMFFFVSSKDEAEKWVVSQGQIVYLFNVNDGVFYVKSVGKNGLPQPIETYSFKKQEILEEVNKEPSIEYVTKEEFIEAQEKIQNEIKKLKPISTTTRKREVKKDD